MSKFDLMSQSRETQARLQSPRKTALKIFLPVPIGLVGLSSLVVVSSSRFAGGVIFFCDVGAAVFAIIATILPSANWFAHRARERIIHGVWYGLMLLFVGALGFCVPHWLLLDNCTFRSCLLVPVGWFGFYGWPVAAFCGLLFAGACGGKR